MQATLAMAGKGARGLGKSFRWASILLLLIGMLGTNEDLTTTGALATVSS
jgi:hypothetical protein